jgi:hypothetical protein
MMNNDNRFDELLQKAAREYNQPPAIVPRDEMWAAIEKAASERAVRPMRIVATPTRRPLITRFAWIGAAAAAVLLVATGVGIGRWSLERGSVDTSAPRTVASTEASGTQAVEGPKSETPGVEAPSVVAGEPELAAPSEPKRGSVYVGEPARAPRVASVAPRAGSAPARRGVTNRSGGPSTAIGGGIAAPSTSYGSTRSEGPYQVAANRHLANAEALLTAFRTDSRDARIDASLSKWARELLSNTRLLLDSPAAEDPQRARLLGDLELVLAQIVQLSPGAAAQDRELIEGSIRNGQVMTRLRTAIPAGPTRGL